MASSPASTQTESGQMPLAVLSLSRCTRTVPTVESLINQSKDIWPGLVAAISLFLSIVCSSHAVLNKRDSRAAAGWVGVIWLTPIIGSVLYFLFGINRVRRLAQQMRPECQAIPLEVRSNSSPEQHMMTVNSAGFLVPLQRLGSAVTKRQLLEGNLVRSLLNGETAFSEMLKAINESNRSITLSTYIFDNDRSGASFIHALARAVERKVEVRVLIDDIGIRYSWHSVFKELKQRKVPVARFMGAMRLRTFPHINLRKHRKILVCDGKVAFTGGLNIREGHDLSLNPTHPVQDIHFKIEGPVVSQLQEVFAKDWAFTTGEALTGEPWFMQLKAEGTAFARVITDGPDEDLNKLPRMIEGAISCAEKSIWIVTPYFLPEMSLTSALLVAAGKGVSVNVVLPAQNNLPFIQWASNPLLPALIEDGCRIWFTPPPFDHTKLMLVDEKWSLFGSANMDPRSLRLNFELNVEVFDQSLAQSLLTIVRDKCAIGRELSARELRDRPLPVRLRDGVARLFSPYL